MEMFLDRVPCTYIQRVVRTLQFVSGVSLLTYAIATFNNFDLAYPWLKLGSMALCSQILMILCAIVQIVCGIFHCYRCMCISSWPAAVMFTYVAVCAKLDDFTRYDLWVAAAVLAAANWFVSSVSSRRMKRDCRGRTTPRGN